MNADPTGAPGDPATRWFRDEQWTLGVVGLGYVGLPLAVLAASRGLGVVGFDVDAERVVELNSSRSHVEDVPDAQVKRALDAGACFTADEAALADADVIVIAVPSPLNRSRQPDMTFIQAAADTVARVVRAGNLVVLESTTYPGTTEEMLVPAMQSAGLVLDESVWIAFSPERVDPGNELTTATIPKVVGGVTARSGQVAAAAYRRIVEDVHVVSTARAAELTKLLENTYRAVNIALVNELAQVAHALEIDIWEVIDAAATKPFGFQAFHPGPGVGGHCIPLDPQFLAHRARELRAATRFIDLAEDVNRTMPGWVAGRVTQILNERGLPLRETAVLGVGLAYKADVGDDRESPSRDVLDRLATQGARVGVLDRHVAPGRIEACGYEVVASDAPLIGWELAVVLTDHAGVDYARLAAEVPVVFDCRGVYRRLGLDAANVVAL